MILKIYGFGAFSIIVCFKLIYFQAGYFLQYSFDSDKVLYSLIRKTICNIKYKQGELCVYLKTDVNGLNMIQS